MRLAKIFIIISFLLIYHTGISKDYYQVTAKQLNIRSFPDKNSSVVGSISFGEKVLIDSVIQGWGQVIVENKIKGYVSTQYLSRKFKEYSENNSTTPSNGSSSENGTSTFITILILLIIFFYAIYKIISYFSRLFGFSSSNSSKNNSILTSKTSNIKWYYCRDCHTLVKTPKQPSNINCKVNGAHRWYSLGELGDNTYLCRDCGIQVRTHTQPTKIYCNVNGSHRWDKL